MDLLFLFIKGMKYANDLFSIAFYDMNYLSYHTKYIMHYDLHRKFLGLIHILLFLRLNVCLL